MHAALLAVQVLFAGHYVVAKLLLANVPAPAWAALRVLSAAVVFLVLYALRGVRPILWRDHASLAIGALLGVVVNQICFVEGLARTTASHSALINTMIPVATVLFAILLGRERPRAVTLGGIAVAFTGVLVLLRVDDVELDAKWLAGDLLTLVNALSFSLFLVVSRDVVRRVGPMASTTGFLCWGSLGVAAFGGAEVAALDPAILDGRNLLLAGYIVAFATVTTYLLNSWALARVESSSVALFIFVQPVIASVLAVALLGETLGPRQFASAALVFGGVLLATRR